MREKTLSTRANDSNNSLHTLPANNKCVTWYITILFCVGRVFLRARLLCKRFFCGRCSASARTRCASRAMRVSLFLSRRGVLLARTRLRSAAAMGARGGARRRRGIGYMQSLPGLHLGSGNSVPAAQFIQRHSKAIRYRHHRIAPARRVDQCVRRRGGRSCPYSGFVELALRCQAQRLADVFVRCAAAHRGSVNPGLARA